MVENARRARVWAERIRVGRVYRRKRRALGRTPEKNEFEAITTLLN